MTSAEEAIEEQLEADSFLRDNIERGVINAKGLADWLVENRDVDYTEGTLAQHIREIQKEAPEPELEAVRDKLDEAEFKTFSNRVAFVVPRTDHIQQRLSRIIGELAIDAGDPVRLVTGERSILLVVDDAGADVAGEILADLGDGGREDLVELRLDPAEEGSDPRLLGLVVEALTAQRIDVVGVHGGASGAFVLIEENDRERALAILGDRFGD